jgi:hypothetical protein
LTYQRVKAITDGTKKGEALMTDTYTSYIGAAGANQDGNVYIHLNGKSLNDVNGRIADFYMAELSVQKEMLATAMAAMTNRWLVLATLDKTDHKSQIRELLLTISPIPGTLEEEFVEVGTEVDVKK